MNNNKQQDSNRQIRSVTNLAIGTNFVLFVIKVLVGLLSGSIALIADGIHSLSDIVTDVAVLLGIHFGTKGPDQEHPYGHGRVETFSALFIAMLLIVVGGWMIWHASMSILKVDSVGDEVIVLWGGVFWVAVLSIVVKEALYRISRKIALKTSSSALYANAWHHRSDALSSVAVVIGFLSVRWWGYVYGDQIAAIAVGMMVVLVSIKIIGSTLRELTECAVDEGTIGVLA